MAPSGEQIRHNLAEFAASWGGYQESEVQEAHTFLTQLLDCYGVDRKAVGATFEELTGGQFMDMFWPGTCIIEMKRPSESVQLVKHTPQAMGYWQSVAEKAPPAPTWVVLCSFHRFVVYKPGESWTTPLADFELTLLPENADALLFLAGEEPGFFAKDELTREAADRVAAMHHSLEEREAADEDILQNFVLQAVWCMFAEDLGMLPNHALTRLVEGLIKQPTRSSADDLGQLFAHLGEPGPRPEHGLYAGTPYANGGLFASPAKVHLESVELEPLREACNHDWTKIEPAIFGSLLQGGLGKEKQWALGAHYTAEADILKVVGPTIRDPWQQRIEACNTVAEAQQAQADLMQYVVLDPACGSGNFLYVAYRELRLVEDSLRKRLTQLRKESGMPEQGELALFPITNMKGIEIDPFAVKLARVTMWIGHKQAVNMLGVDEPTLPLIDLSGIQRGDSLRIDWPSAQAIVSNPPYHGSQRLRKELGDDYVDWLKQEFGIGVKDYAAYWFRRVQLQLPDGGRAGLVVTNSITQNRNREPTLEWILDQGAAITDAVSTQDWSGDAAVDVSIINWIKAPGEAPAPVLLDGVDVEKITSSLRSSSTDVASAARLRRNSGSAFQGPIPGNRGFVLSDEVAGRLLESGEANYADVVRPYLIGDDIAATPTQSPSRFVIDFGVRTLEQASQYPAALEHIKMTVKPERDVVRRKARREHWWRFAESAVGMRASLEGLSRYIAGTATGKRILFCWADVSTCPSNAMNVFAFEDDFGMGVLSSSVHDSWAKAQSSTLEDRIRYTPTSAFETFPWPSPSPTERTAVGRASAAIINRRQSICQSRQIGLTQLYNEVDEGAYADLAQLHRELDLAVVNAYGWPTSTATDVADSNRRLLELNQAIGRGEVSYEPFSGGVHAA